MIKKSYEDIISGSEKPICKAENKIDEKVTERPVAMKNGPMSQDEISTILKLEAEGKSLEYIANELNRSVRGVRKSLMAQKNKNKNKNNESRSEDNEMAKETKQREKKVDIGGIAALAKAGWTPRQIAGEHDLSIEEVQEILSELRKKKA
jgi:DNA-binding NarL/FixJ family response regulator